MNSSILLIDDEKDLLDWLSVVLEKEGYRVRCATSGEEGIRMFRQEPSDMVMSDIRMGKMSGIDVLRQIKQLNPEVIVLLMTAYAAVDTAVKALRYGASDYLTKPFQLDELKLGIKKAFSQRRLFSDDKVAGRKLRERYQFANIVGKSKPMQQVFSLVDKVAKTSTTVLIQGESGTGKELIARAIHYNSLHPDKPFVSIDCGALPDDLLESELFGHIKGSFTGAIASKQGLFEVAHGGTLFLDEIGEMSPALQSKLLRALQEREIRPVGATKTIKIDVRVVAATNRNLEEEVRRGQFRKDLFYRISVISVYLPRLAERPEDIAVLAQHFLRKYQLAGKPPKRVSEECLQLFNAYPWPGNVRELENAIESAVALSEGEIIGPDDVPARLRAGAIGVSGEFTADESLKSKVEQFEKQLIVRHLAETKGNKNQVAQILKMTRRNLDYKIKRYGL